jgi:hypothetical protein
MRIGVGEYFIPTVEARHKVVERKHVRGREAGRVLSTITNSKLAPVIRGDLVEIEVLR